MPKANWGRIGDVMKDKARGASPFTGTGKDFAAGATKSGISLGINTALNGGPSLSDVVNLSINLGGLAVRGATHAARTQNVKQGMSDYLREYEDANYLLKEESPDPKATRWVTTWDFHKANFLLKVYRDIEHYILDQNITDDELNLIGWRNDVTIWENRKMPDVMEQLAKSCAADGVRDVTVTDLQKRFSNVSFPHIGDIALTNAMHAEKERRARLGPAGVANDRRVVPVVGRIIALLALCGVREIRLSDIAEILGKIPMFESVARTRIASLRNHHATHIINSVLFGGSTESTARGFAEQAAYFKDKKVVVGQVSTPGHAAFDSMRVRSLCEFSSSVDRRHPAATPIYMLAGWAELITQREAFEKEHSALQQIGHISSPCSNVADIHGNKFMHSGEALGKLTFTVKELPDGTLMAKPRKFDKFDYLCSASFSQGSNNTKATGEEKHFGGIVGPVHCGCNPDQYKAALMQNWKYGENIRIRSRDFVGNSIEHTRQMSSKHVAILWRPGDWPLGVFLMQTLPQSSYMQGKGECLHCAVENAALAGCPEVIACGGGRVTEEARAMPNRKDPPLSPKMPQITSNLEKHSPTQPTIVAAANGLPSPPLPSPPFEEPKPARVLKIVNNDPPIPQPQPDKTFEAFPQEPRVSKIVYEEPPPRDPRRNNVPRMPLPQQPTVAPTVKQEDRPAQSRHDSAYQAMPPPQAHTAESHKASYEAPLNQQYDDLYTKDPPRKLRVVNATEEVPPHVDIRTIHSFVEPPNKQPIVIAAVDEIPWAPMPRVDRNAVEAQSPLSPQSPLMSPPPPYSSPSPNTKQNVFSYFPFDSTAPGKENEHRQPTQSVRRKPVSPTQQQAPDMSARPGRMNSLNVSGHPMPYRSYPTEHQPKQEVDTLKEVTFEQFPSPQVSPPISPSISPPISPPVNRHDFPIPVEPVQPQAPMPYHDNPRVAMPEGRYEDSAHPATSKPRAMHSHSHYAMPMPKYPPQPSMVHYEKEIPIEAAPPADHENYIAMMRKRNRNRLAAAAMAGKRMGVYDNVI